MFNIKLGETEYVNAKVENINRGDHFYNATVILDDDNRINIKIFDGNIYLEIGKVYQFEIVKTIKNEDIIYELNNVVPIEHLYSGEGLLDILHTFYHYAPIGLKDIKLAVEGYLKKIKDPVLNKLTNAIYDDYKEQYYLHPAATKFHHAYVGGLSFHSLTMLKLSDSVCDVYPYLNRDLIYSGIILHDIGKIKEITGVDGEYTVEGQLLGHIVIGTDLVERYSYELEFDNEEIVLLLKHVITSHHGQLNFGSPKKPQLGEALVIWLLDTMDSKLAVLGEELDKTKPGEFTNSIPVLDKMRFYKSKNNNKK